MSQFLSRLHNIRQNIAQDELNGHRVQLKVPIIHYITQIFGHNLSTEMIHVHAMSVSS